MRKSWVSGPVIDIEFSAPGPQGTPEVLQAIIDTGASVICVDSRVPKRLGLISVNRKPMQMADEREILATSYLARMKIEDLEFDERVEVYGVPMFQPSNRAAEFCSADHFFVTISYLQWASGEVLLSL